jgi:hypothetical protein
VITILGGLTNRIYVIDDQPVRRCNHVARLLTVSTQTSRLFSRTRTTGPILLTARWLSWRSTPKYRRDKPVARGHIRMRVTSAFLAPMRFTSRPSVALRLHGASRCMSSAIPQQVKGGDPSSSSTVLRQAAETCARDSAKILVARGTLHPADEPRFAALTPRRAALFQRVVESRTRHISFCLDDVHGLHNFVRLWRTQAPRRCQSKFATIVSLLASPTNSVVAVFVSIK